MDTIIERSMPDLNFELLMDEILEKITVKFTKEVQVVEIELRFGEEEFSISTSTQNLTTNACLFLCALGVVGPAIDCYRKNKKNWKGFKKCMEEQANAIGQAGLICAFNCLDK